MRRRSHRITTGLLAAGLALAATPEAHAIIRRHDVEDARYRVDPAEYPAVVDLFEPGDCLGTLVEASYVLTVAHCAVDLDVGGALTFDGTSHPVAEVILHPSWTDADAFDIALVRLAEPVQGIDPVPLHRHEDERGALVTLVGRGLTGTGLEGEPGGEDDATLRRATNVVTAVSEHFLEITFERHDDPGVTPLEGVGAAGDSGGPVFVTVGGTQLLAGLNSWGDGGSCYEVGQYGARDYQTRISQYLDWLEDELGPLPEAPTDADALLEHGSTIPERRDPDACVCTIGGGPPSLALLLLLAGGVRRRRSAR